MTVLQALILGIIQGATEFLPISSSAHLVLAPVLLGWELDPELAFVFDVLVQVGTILAVIAYFWRDWWQIGRAVLRGLWRRAPFETHHARLGWLIALATIPAVVLGLLFKDFFESMFENPTGVAALLLVTAALLSASERFGRHGQSKLSAGASAPAGFAIQRPGGRLQIRREQNIELKEIRWPDALVMGCFQALAIFPGISRSGSTIAGGLLRGLDRKSAARFSFLMAVPVMLGAGVVAIKDLLEIDGWAQHLPVIAIGFVAAVIVGLLSIHWLLGYLTRHSLYGFAMYCTLVGLAGLLAGCTPVTAAETAAPVQTIAIGATLATQPLAEQWAESYPGDVPLTVAAYPSNRRLLAALQASEIAAGVSLYNPPASELAATPLARTALGIVVHPANPVADVSGEQLQAIFSGAIDDWIVLGSAPGSIRVASREESADVRGAFDALALGDLRPTLNAAVMPSDQAMLEFVAQTPEAIGYVALNIGKSEVSRLRQGDIKLLTINGVAASPDEGYPLAVNVLALTLAEPEGEVRAWLGWAQTEGQATLSTGYGPLP